MSNEAAHLVLPWRQGTYEASLLALADNDVLLTFDLGGILHVKTSADAGRSWAEPWPVMTTEGEALRGFRTSPLLLASGALGLLYSGPAVREGRDGPLLYVRSDDGGRTWTTPVAVDPVFAVARNGTGMVLRDGRIVAPVFVWLSADATQASENENYSICYSFVYMSDDEGRCWQKSGSELFVSRDCMRSGGYSFEEPTVAELADGRLLMYGRTEMGRPYSSVSSDRGYSWTWPEPAAVASSYAPFLLRRIPDTTDVLGVWTQASEEETLRGLSRHRLTAAVSHDEGHTWGHFRNLESLDDVACVEPPDDFRIIRGEGGYQPPTDTGRYHRTPAHLRVCYPSVAFVGDEVLVTYDIDAGPDQPGLHGTRLRMLPRDWFYT
jgi:hypothetical protein